MPVVIPATKAGCNKPITIPTDRAISSAKKAN